ncbi:MAG: hypothetical protein R2788_05480 [Saprospiraceae bacterium]
MAGIVMLIGKGDSVLMDKYGMQNIEEGKPMAFNTIFRLAS